MEQEQAAAVLEEPALEVQVVLELAAVVRMAKKLVLVLVPRGEVVPVVLVPKEAESNKVA